MDKKQFAFIALASIALILLIVFSFFEIKDVPDHDWKSTYDLDKEAPRDLYVFKKLLQERFGSDKFDKVEESVSLDTSYRNTLFMAIGSQIFFSNKRMFNLKEYIEAGNDAMLIGDYIDIDIEIKPSLNDSTKQEYFIDTLSLDYTVDIADRFTYSDSLQEYNDYDTIVEENIIDTLSNQYYTNINREMTGYLDTVFNFSFAPFDSSMHSFDFVNYGRDLDDSVSSFFRCFYKETSFEFENLAYTINDQAFFVRQKMGSGYLYLHTMPELFTNVGTRQNYFLDHFNAVFANLDADRVFIEVIDPKNRQITGTSGDFSNSPLEFILSTPSLAWAYYLLVLTMILFVIFRGKRTQKVIPTMEENKNTSLEYINTLSSLYQNQKQNSKLVKHMRDGFNHRIKSKYYLDHKDEFFIEKLTAKSKIEKTEIENLIHKLYSTVGAEFTDDQLIILHNQIETFYQKAK